MSGAQARCRLSQLLSPAESGAFLMATADCSAPTHQCTEVLSKTRCKWERCRFAVSQATAAESQFVSFCAPDANDVMKIDPNQLPRRVEIDVPERVLEWVRQKAAETGRDPDELLLELLDRGLQQE